MNDLNLPAEREPVTPAPRGRRRWRWPTLGVAGVLALCVGVPAGYLVWPLVRGTLDADRGQPSPGAALQAFVFTFADAPDSIAVDRLIVPERREQIGRQRRAYLTAMQIDLQRMKGWSAGFEIGTEQPGDGAQVHGDRATAVDSYRVRWTPSPDARTGPLGLVWFDGGSHPWRAEVRRDRTGWRLWSVTIPPWCGTYSRCKAAPDASPSPSPSPSPDDPLGAVRSLLPCAPNDPLRQLHACSSPSPSGS